MAVQCAVAASLSDAETLELIRVDDIEFYGSECEITVPLLTTSDDDEHLSSTEDDRVLLRSVTELAVTGPSTDGGGDGELEVIADEFKKGCCKERCYEQFSPPEILDFKLSMRELTKGERDLILMGKLQVVIRDPATISHARAKKPTKRQRLTCTCSITGVCVKKPSALYMR